MQEDLRSLLVGLGAPTVVWGARPQGSALPAIRLSIVSERVDYAYGGAVDLITSRVQADIFGETYGTVLAVDRALAVAVSGFRGVVGETTFSAIFLESRFDGNEEPAAGAAALHRISRDLIVMHRET